MAIHWAAKGEGLASYVQEAFAWQEGDWLIGLSARGMLSPGTERTDSSPVLDSLVLKPFNPQALCKVRLGSHSFQVPVMTPMERVGNNKATTVRLAWPPGSIEVSAFPPENGLNSEVRAARILGEQKLRLASTSLSVPRSIYRWFGSGLLEGLQYRAPQNHGNGEVDVRMWLIPTEHDVIAVTFALADERYRPAPQREL